MHTDRATTYEHTDAKVRPIVYTGLALVVLCASGFVAAWAATGLFERRTNERFEDVSPLFVRDIPKEAPLLADEPAYAAEYMKKQTARLTSYGWVDQGTGVVHIPIERAMELVAKEAP